MRDYTVIVKDVFPYMVDVRRHIHASPCLTDDEYETAKYISLQLEELGIKHHVTKENNVIAKLGSGEGKRLALRADMDALPIKEETGLPFSSKKEGVMHACGHDIHVANLLGVAKVLSNSTYSIDGTIYLCFQVGEEQSKGATDVLNYLEAVGGVDSCLGMHVNPSLETGSIETRVGSIMAGSSIFTITFSGLGGHGSTPWLSVDPIKPACETALRLAALPSTNFSAFDSVVINPCSISSGTAGNIVPETAILKGNIRYFKEEHLKEITSLIEKISEGISESYGTRVTVEFSPCGTPPMINQEEAFFRLAKVMEETPYTFSDMPLPWMASDNYALYLKKYGGLYFFGGVTKGGTVAYPIHNSRFNPDEESLHIFCEVFLRYIDEFFSES